MWLSEPIIPLPPRLRTHYQVLRTLLYVTVIMMVSIFTLRVLFPTLLFSFNFKTPSSSKNNLLDPRAPDTTPRTNGKVEAQGTLLANVGAIGNFSHVATTVTLEKKSAVPQSLEFALRRAYRGFFLPTGSPVTNFPSADLYNISGAYYMLRDGTLYPFISDNAYLSRYPADFAKPEGEDFLAQHPVSEEWMGFRVGSILSFADGVFLITSDTEMRPVGSAEIFLALGYRFEDVRPASEEELGIYKRGKIFLLGARHPDGTLFLDQDTQTYYLIADNMKHPLTDTVYRDFIREQQTPILVSSQGSDVHVRCTLKLDLFGQHFSCSAPLDTLRHGVGPDYEISVSGSDMDIDINMLRVSFATEKSSRNMLTLLSQIKQRLLSRFGFE